MPVLCAVGRHRWVTRHDGGDEPYQQCERCGHYDTGRHSWLALVQDDRLPTDHTPGSGGASGGFVG